MNLHVQPERLDTFFFDKPDSGSLLKWGSVFIHPAWLKTWWQVFAPESNLYLLGVRDGQDLIGIAPLMRSDETASLIGSADVCDYLDFIVTPGREDEFFTVILDHMTEDGIVSIDLGPLRPDSTVFTHLVNIAKHRAHEVSCTPEDISLEMDLPASWDEYLGRLNGKQRHEIRRKLRRIDEKAEVVYRVVEGVGKDQEALRTFLELFEKSRDDKAAFMSLQMRSFFETLAHAMMQEGLLRIGVLDLDGEPCASLFCLDFNNTLHLYNSGYDPRFNDLSIGIVCKALSIKDSIARGLKKYDFLKGAEIYKYRMGGNEIPLSRCHIRIA